MLDVQQGLKRVGPVTIPVAEQRFGDLIALFGGEQQVLIDLGDHVPDGDPLSLLDPPLLPSGIEPLLGGTCAFTALARPS